MDVDLWKRTGHSGRNRSHSAEGFEEAHRGIRIPLAVADALQRPHCALGQQDGPLPRNERPRNDSESAAREVDPADDLFQRLPRDPPGQQRIECAILRTAVPGGICEDRSLVLGEDAACGPQSVDEALQIGFRAQRRPRVAASRDFPVR